MIRTIVWHLLSILFAIVIAMPGTADAQSACGDRFIGKTIRFIVPHAAGGGYDTYARMVAPHYAAATGARALVENWTGGNGLIGANKILAADPDGLTFGILAAPKLIAAQLLGDPNAPNLLRDFHVFARAARGRHIWIVNASAGIGSIEQILSADPPLLYGTTDTRSHSLLGALLTTAFLKFDFDILSGVVGTKKRILALIRNDIDFFSVSYSSVRAALESGEVKAVLQVSATQIDDHPVLQGVPLLGGGNGYAAQRAAELGTDVEEAIALAAATEAFIGAGRLFVGPAGFEPELGACIERTFLDVLNDDAVRSDSEKLYRPLDVAAGKEVTASLADSFAILDDHLHVIKSKTAEFAQ